MNHKNKIRVITESAVLIAVAIILDFIAGFYSPFPYGGSISVAMLPIFFLSYRHGVKIGVLSGFIFGVLQSLVAVGSNQFYFVSLVQYFLDYILAFSVLGLAGIFKNGSRKQLPFLAGITLGSFLRYLAHGFSGVAFFAEYAPEGMNVWFYSFVAYNLPYMGASLVLCLIIGEILWKRGVLSEKTEPTQPNEK